ncbi:MAG TPA: sulfite exporter TauE/SafE family protein [Xanthomonadaceae bacterium]|nr:sulfite exporter TauE/SafE family protein [Xanthomonadaceae bacterium]
MADTTAMLIEWSIFLALGLVAGLLAGLLGIGGGLVIVVVLAWLLPRMGVPPEAAMHAALATALASIVFTAMASARAHHLRGSVLWPSVWRLVPGLLAGGVLGGLLATQLEGIVLRALVSVYCFVAAVQIGFGSARHGGARPDAPRSPWLAPAGVGIGAVSALVGIGGGSMTVPLLVYLGIPPVRAVGTSSACGVAIGLASAAAYALFGPAGALPEGGLGYVYVPAAVGIALASILAAPYGTRLAHVLSGPALRRVFAVFLVVVGASLWLPVH